MWSCMQPPGVILFYPFFPFQNKESKPVQRIPDLLAEKVFALFKLLALFEQPHWKILNWELLHRWTGLHLKCTESAQASLTGRWLRCSSRVWVTWNIFANDSLGLILRIPTFTGANLSCKLDLSSRMRRLSLVASLPASTKWVCSKSRARVLSPILSLGFDFMKKSKTFSTWTRCWCWPSWSASHSQLFVSCSLHLSRAAAPRT